MPTYYLNGKVRLIKNGRSYQTGMLCYKCPIYYPSARGGDLFWPIKTLGDTVDHLIEHMHRGDISGEVYTRTFTLIEEDRDKLFAGIKYVKRNYGWIK